MRLPVNQYSFRIAPLAAALLLSGCGGGGAELASALPSVPATGPSADYPMVLGDPFTIGSVTWTPSDQLNYDAVGLAVTGGEDLVGVSAAHKTLPLPSYAEVTSLDSGRTILVRVEKRGPMVNETLVALSPAAVTQLGLAAGTSAQVRVRRVNPPEIERAALRQGSAAPERMDTPESLLKVLRRKLAEQSPMLVPPQARAEPAQGVLVQTASPVVPLQPATKPVPPKSVIAAIDPDDARKPAVAPEVGLKDGKQLPVTDKKATKTQGSAKGSTIVQIGAFSVEANARKAASQMGGTVSKAGKFWRVHLGPYTSRAQAGPALEKARSAGYRDARIQQAD